MGRAVLVVLVLFGVVPAQIPSAPVAAERGMVVSTEASASRAGVEILAKGGNAVDAAVAVGFALAVTWPSAGNLGGGLFFVIRLEDGRLVALDARETAPARATRDMFLDEKGKAVAARSREGALASGVPGSVAGLCHAQKHHGKLPLATVMAPAIRLARDGFTVSRILASSLRGDAELLAKHPTSKAIFLADGKGRKEGELFRQPELAATLERIAEKGADDFYRGRTAELIVEESRRSGGLLGAEDLAGYEVKLREPVRGKYRGYEIVSMPPPSSGGVALIQMLNLLEPYPLAELGRDSERRAHLMVEAMRTAFRDRALHLGDPDFASVPAKGLVSKAYADECRKEFGDQARKSAALAGGDPFAYEKTQTTHFSTMDKSGVAVACTTTLNGGYGSGVTIPGAGFLMNNEMDDFAAAPGQPNMFDLIQGEANAVGPRKRPLSSMTPTLVLEDGEVVMVIGSPGGPTIINTVLHCIVNVLDHGANIQEAVARPRFHHQWLPDRILFEAGAFTPEAKAALEKRGHVLEPRRSIGDAHGIWRDRKSGRFFGGADPRLGGLAAGY